MAVCALTNHLCLSNPPGHRLALRCSQITCTQGQQWLGRKQARISWPGIKGISSAIWIKGQRYTALLPASLKSGEEECRAVGLPFSLPSIGSCESVNFGGGMRPNVALFTMLLGLSREAVDEQEGGRRKKRGKWAAAPSCANPHRTHSSWKPAKGGS